MRNITTDPKFDAALQQALSRSTGIRLAFHH